MKYLSVLILVGALASLLGCGSSNVPALAKGWVPEIETPQYFAVLVQDVDKSVDWYRSVFSLRAIGGSEADDGSWRIENLQNDDLAVEIIFDARAQDVDRALGFRKVGFQVADVDIVADRVAQQTGERPRVVEFAQTGMRIVQLRDPDGNTVQLFSPLDSE